ncbi:MAG: sigma-70 family RNA polymerase sigma factor [Myxococcota bacterium]|jgi:RNA polymerase sigma-70 factor (ECF subfamily)|nr:sigma-70 family RNA polymerase sigma factor [Myxococcota bacterium]
MRPTLTAIYEEHYEYVWRTLLRLGVRDAEDAAQNVFLVAHRKLSTFDPTRPIRPWLFGIAFNVARETRRKASERYERAIGSNGDSIGDVIGDLHSSDASRLEAAQLVHVALAEVEESRRAVFVLYELDQEPMKEVADALGIPLNTAYSSLRRARQEFCDAVERLGGR